MSLHNLEENNARNSLTYEQKNHALFLREKELLDALLEHGATAVGPHPSSGLRETPDATFPKGEGKAQHDKSLRDLKEKMGEM